jgi:hypothetical protein
VRSLSSTELGFDYSEEEGFFYKAIEFDIDQQANSLKFHDIEPSPKREGTTRVLLLGDSYVAGVSTPIEQTVGRRLEYHLNSISQQRFDVVAIGIEGSAQREQLYHLRQLGPSLRPDIVITLFLTLNDVRGNSQELTAEQRAQQARSIRNSMALFRPDWPLLSKHKAPFFWIEQSVLNQFVSFRLAQLRYRQKSQPIPVDYMVYRRGYETKWEDAWLQTEALLLKTRNASREAGAHSYFLVSASTPQGVLGVDEGLRVLERSYPAMKNFTWDLGGPDQRLDRFCKGNSIPFLLLEKRFRTLAREQGVELHWKIDGHWNAAGNDHAGKLIGEFIMSQLSQMSTSSLQPARN